MLLFMLFYERNMAQRLIAQNSDLTAGDLWLETQSIYLELLTQNCVYFEKGLTVIFRK